jgi:hypothetical protein
MATYTFTQKPQPVEPGQESLFGNLRNDASRNALTGVVANGVQTVDISASPIVSPATVSNSAVTTLTIPLNAVQVTFLATTNTVNISEADATVATKYFTIPTGVQVVVPVALTSVLYLKANTGASTLSFYFDII